MLLEFWSFIFDFKEKILVFSSFLLLELTSLGKVANHLGNSDSLDFKKNLKEIIGEILIPFVSDQPVFENGPV